MGLTPPRRGEHDAARRAAVSEFTAPAPTILAVLTALATSLMPAALERLVLLVNHVLWAEPAAVERLRGHAGRRMRIEWQVEPGPWPAPPAVGLLVTAAGLFELVEAHPDAPDLRLRIALAAPHRQALQWLAGAPPEVAVEGDAQFAADLAWLGQNLRWDVAHDLERLLGPAPAQAIARLGEALRALLPTAAAR